MILQHYKLLYMHMLKFVVQGKFTELFCHENCNSIEIFITIYVKTICIYQSCSY